MNFGRTLLALASVAAMVAPASAGAAESCRVSLQITQGGRVLHSQEVQPQPGAPIHLALGRMGELDLVVEVERLPQGWVRARSTATAPGRTSVTATTFRDGQPATMALDDLKLAFAVERGGC